MKTLYLCGPISNCTDAQCIDWRLAARERLKHKFNILDPMRRDHRGREEGNAASIVGMDYWDVRASDALLVNANPSPDSWGTPMEVKEAFDSRRLLVVAFRNPTHVRHPWLVMHTHFIARDLDDACAFLLLE